MICECNDSDCVPSSEEHFKADDSLTSLAERVAANAALKREKGEKMSLNLGTVKEIAKETTNKKLKPEAPLVERVY